MKRFERIAVVRTDSIGDVMLTLPLVGVIKSLWDCELTFIGKGYTKSVVRCCAHVDEFQDWDAVKDLSFDEQISWIRSMKLDAIIFAFPDKSVLKAASAAGVKCRVATGKRLHSLKYANKWAWFSRKKSDLHEAQLNIKLLSVFGVKSIPNLGDLPALQGFTELARLKPEFIKVVGKKRIILHPKSQGSAVEWGSENFSALIQALEMKDVEIVITGTQKEFELVRDELPFQQANVANQMGKMSLEELIAFINTADAMVAASTGPLHIAAALGVRTIGLYTPQRPMHPGRWAPIGSNSVALESLAHPTEGNFLEISVDKVIEKLNLG
ncbi:MAG: heptosyltransferase-3 [Flavobacteriales bacterium]|jgi:heptosyltransferase-3